MTAPVVLAPKLLALLPPEDRLVVVDAGARGHEQQAFWAGVAATGRLTVIGFEPDAAEASRMNGIAGPIGEGTQYRFIGKGLWSETSTKEFEHNASPGGSSFFHQNTELTARWRFVFGHKPIPAHDLMRPTGHEPMEVVRLDEWCEDNSIPCVDFLKMNVQGAELEIMRGAGRLMDGVLGVLTEVSFVESYRKRPFFSDIDTFLRERGLHFFNVSSNCVGRNASPVSVNHVRYGNGPYTLAQVVGYRGQMIEGDALYLRDPLIDAPTTFESTQVIRLAALAEAFGQVEYAFELIARLAEKIGEGENIGPGFTRLTDIIRESAKEYGA